MCRVISTCLNIRNYIYIYILSVYIYIYIYKCINIYICIYMYIYIDHAYYMRSTSTECATSRDPWDPCLHGRHVERSMGPMCAPCREIHGIREIHGTHKYIIWETVYMYIYIYMGINRASI